MSARGVVRCYRDQAMEQPDEKCPLCGLPATGSEILIDYADGPARVVLGARCVWHHKDGTEHGHELDPAVLGYR